MALTPGTRLGPYEITAQIGVGGMGEVYRATDTKLDRDVAIKVLPASLAADPERIARFQREAKTLAALNHPNIAQVHGLEESEGTKALVMELVEGPTLEDRIVVDPTISVVVPVRGAGQDLRECLRAVADADPPPAEVVVVIDGDQEEPQGVDEACGARVLRIGTCGGPARARNQGARVAGGDILFFIDADVVVRPDAVGQVAAIFKREPHLAAVFGSYDDAPSGRNFLSQYKNLLHHYIHQTSSEDASTFWAACGAIRRDVFMSAGGFDERYVQPSVEDLELGWRLTQAGYAIRLCKSLQARHVKCWTAASLLRSDFFHRALPWTELILRDRRFINDLNLQLSSRVSVALAYALVLTLIASPWWPGLVVFSGLPILALLVLNAPLYRFFQRKRGVRFALQCIPWHWFYYLYGGFAFGIGTATYLGRALLKTGAFRARTSKPSELP